MRSPTKPSPSSSPSSPSSSPSSQTPPIDPGRQESSGKTKGITGGRTGVTGVTGGVTGRQQNLALLAGLSVALYTVENLIPLPIPWLRIGVGNIGVLLALYILSPLDGFFVLLIKVVIGSLLSGRFLSPFFLFALGAGIPSYWIMVATKKLFGRWFGPVGVSVAGAVSHNIFQLAIAYLIVVQSVTIFYLTPILVVLGTVAGALIGAAVRSILPHLGIDKTSETAKISG
ncbi:Gx transporter family protein [candidate division WOR-3 bacterium]|nr:Gx transporter family protein [candidate division WOR-3 bacterium]